jgi:hypothetical protein
MSAWPLDHPIANAPLLLVMLLGLANYALWHVIWPTLYFAS